MRATPLDWHSLALAFQDASRLRRWYLHAPTGTVLEVIDGTANPAVIAAFERDPSHLRIRPVPPRDQYAWMESFLDRVHDAAVREELEAAMATKGAFRKFRDIISCDPVALERWTAFRRERLLSHAGAWLREQGVALPPARGRAPIDEFAEDALAGIRRRLILSASTLTPAELKSVLRLAEFLLRRHESRMLRAARAAIRNTVADCDSR